MGLIRSSSSIESDPLTYVSTDGRSTVAGSLHRSLGVLLNHPRVASNLTRDYLKYHVPPSTVAVLGPIVRQPAPVLTLLHYQKGDGSACSVASTSTSVVFLI